MNVHHRLHLEDLIEVQGYEDTKNDPPTSLEQFEIRTHKRLPCEGTRNCPSTSRLYEIVAYLAKGLDVPIALHEYLKHAEKCSECHAICETAKWSLWREVLNERSLAEQADGSPLSDEVELTPSSPAKDEGVFPIGKGASQRPLPSNSSARQTNASVHLISGSQQQSKKYVVYEEIRDATGWHLVGMTEADSSNQFLRQTEDLLIYLVKCPEELADGVLFRTWAGRGFHRFQNDIPPLNDRSDTLTLDGGTIPDVPWGEQNTEPDDLVLEIRIPQRNMGTNPAEKDSIEGYLVRVIRFSAKEWRSRNVSRFMIQRRSAESR